MTLVVLGALWALWPVVALAGGLGFSVLSGVAALLLLPVIARSLRPRLYFAVLVVFLVFVGVSSVWSPRDQVLVEIDFIQMKFAVRSEMLRVGLQILAQGCLIAAAMRLTDPNRVALQRIAHIALSMQLVILVVLTLFEQQILAALTAIVPDTGESVQNISRNSLIMAVAAPVLTIGAAVSHRAGRAIALALLILAPIAAVLVVREVHTGLLALVASACAVATVHLLPRFGFKLIGLLAAALIISAPYTFGMLTNGADFATAEDSASYRAAIWQHVIKMINDHPLTGGGVGVLRTVTDTIDVGVFAGQLKVPNHSHNMMLQVWAETGAIGAGLLSVAILLAAWRIPDARKIGPSALKGAALVGGMIAVAGVSFDLWNEWWWAVGGLLTTLAVATPSRVTKLSAKDDIGLTFGETRPLAPASVTEPASHETMIAHVPTLPHENNFNLLRLALAVMVALYHAIALSNLAGSHDAEAWLALFAEIGVQGFFVVSGYLVWASLERSSSLLTYAEKRVRRLVPGYATVVVVCAAGALILVPVAREELGAVASYLGWNVGFLNFMAPNLPGVFEGNRFTEVNGALWTLKIEVMFYLILPVLAWFAQRAGGQRWILFAIIYVGAELWRSLLPGIGSAQSGPWIELSRQLPGQMSFFVTGIALCAWRKEINWRSMLLPVGGVALVLSILIPQAEALRAAGLGIVAIGFAVAAPRLPDAARLGDLSYGLYIVHFPIIQCVVASGIFRTSPALGFVAAAGASFAAALALWWLVERPALRADSAYRRADVARA